MAIHSYSRCWLHLIWSTYRREKVLPRDVRIALSEHLYQYAKSKRIYMPGNYVNADHVHCLIDLPTNYTIEQTAKLLKGSSSHWVNKHNLVRPTLRWGRGYGVFSVSQSRVRETLEYILHQESHHRLRSFREEYQEFIRAYRLRTEAAGNR